MKSGQYESRRHRWRSLDGSQGPVVSARWIRLRSVSCGNRDTTERSRRARGPAFGHELSLSAAARRGANDPAATRGRIPRSFASILALTAMLAATLHAAEPDYRSEHLSVGLSRTTAAFTAFAVDSLGQGKLDENPVLAGASAIAGLELDGQIYRLNGKPAWRIAWSEKTLTLISDPNTGTEAPPFTLTFHQKLNHATLLGMMKPGERRMSLPCVLHLPGMGSLRITCNAPGASLDYDARRRVEPPFVRIAFPPAAVDDEPVEYRLEVVTIHPHLPGVEKDPRYDGFRRNWLNIFQVNPRVQMLANNSSSDPCSFTLFEYSELARHTPPLADGLTANDLIRMTLDRYLAGALGYGQVGYACTPTEAELIAWKTPWTSLDTLPSLLISACNYVEGSGDLAWGRANYDKLSRMGPRDVRRGQGRQRPDRISGHRQLRRAAAGR